MRHAKRSENGGHCHDHTLMMTADLWPKGRLFLSFLALELDSDTHSVRRGARRTRRRCWCARPLMGIYAPWRVTYCIKNRWFKFCLVFCALVVRPCLMLRKGLNFLHEQSKTSSVSQLSCLSRTVKPHSNYPITMVLDFGCIFASPSPSPTKTQWQRSRRTERM